MAEAIRIVTVALMLAIPLCLAGCTETETHGGRLPDEELQILSHSMTVHEFTGGMPESTAVVKGRARNIGNFTIEFALIAADFYDSGGTLIDSSSAIRQNLGVGEVWDFTVQITGPDAWKSVNYDIAASTKQ